MDFEPRLTILHQAGMLSEEDCRKVQDVIRFFQEKYGLTLTEENASAMITHLCAALGRIHRGEPVEPLDEEVCTPGHRIFLLRQPAKPVFPAWKGGCSHQVLQLLRLCP